MPKLGHYEECEPVICRLFSDITNDEKLGYCPYSDIMQDVKL